MGPTKPVIMLIAPSRAHQRRLCLLCFPCDWYHFPAVKQTLLRLIVRAADVTRIAVCPGVVQTAHRIARAKESQPETASHDAIDHAVRILPGY